MVRYLFNRFFVGLEFVIETVKVVAIGAILFYALYIIFRTLVFITEVMGW